MDGKTKVRLGVGLAGLLTFVGSFALISSPDESEIQGESPDPSQSPFLESGQGKPCPVLYMEEEEGFLSPTILPKQEGWSPQTRTRAS